MLGKVPFSIVWQGREMPSHPMFPVLPVMSRSVSSPSLETVILKSSIPAESTIPVNFSAKLPSFPCARQSRPMLLSTWWMAKHFPKKKTENSSIAYRHWANLWLWWSTKSTTTRRRSVIGNFWNLVQKPLFPCRSATTDILMIFMPGLNSISPKKKRHWSLKPMQKSIRLKKWYAI